MIFKGETKTKAAAAVAFAATVVGTVVLEGLDLSGLPSIAGAVAAGAVTSALAWLAAYRTKHASEALSASALEAARRRMNGLRPDPAQH